MSETHVGEMLLLPWTCSVCSEHHTSSVSATPQQLRCVVCSTLRPPPLSFDSDRSSAGESKSGKQKSGKQQKKKSGKQKKSSKQNNMVLVYGGNAEGLSVGNAQKDVASNFPKQFQEIHLRLATMNQVMREEHGEERWEEVITSNAYPLQCSGQWSGNEIMASKKRGFALRMEDDDDDDDDEEEMEEDKKNMTMRLVHCTVFPRNAVAEQEICRNVFRRAVEEILPLCSKRTKEEEEEELHVVTHGISVFTGHPDPGAFARSMAHGLGDVLSNIGVN